ncbi:MAG: YebC/PmpR family DNA-binding transcriptional regulator [Legionellales bacterium]|nr:YebC/PmpR family DNA-binding transcriptional regulator [Legionellales bacterium]
MAGHSKWANIRFRKGAQDAKRGKLFTKLIREITTAAKQGGGPDPSINPRLRTAIDKALSNNMTRDAVDRAIKRAGGADGEADLLDITYEGYGVGGVAVLVECLTDNKNRSVSDVRHAFTKFGGNLGTDGSVAYLFEKAGQLIFTNVSEEKLLEPALEAGAEDVFTNEDNDIEVRTSPDNFVEVKTALSDAGFKADVASVSLIPSTMVSLDVDQASTFLKMTDKLEELDDVQNVYSNADIPAEVLEQL